MANAYNYSNTAIQTTLSGNISAGATSLAVAATTGFPTTPYILAVDYGAATEELVLVTNVGGTTLTVTRGFSGTSAQSHSIGAIVRHVVNAQDLIDFRTHEAATAGVHGVTGTLVGATQSQTLTNKTLTSPTVNGGALSGTFTGTHTYSGAVTLSGGGSLSGTFTGNPTLSGTVTVGLMQKTGATATDNAYTTMVTGDSVNRFAVRSDGHLTWGSGTASRDVNLYRSAADVLRTDDSLTVGAGVTATDLTVTNVANLNTLLVNTVTPGSTSIPSGSLLSASTGWSVSSLSGGVLKAGIVTANINFTRAGGTITANSVGALSTGIIQMGTINGVYRPDTDLGTMYLHAGNSLGTGTARIGPGGVVDLIRFQAGQTISNGDTVSGTITYSL